MTIGILLGESDSARRQYVGAFLEREGFEVLGATSDSLEFADLAVRLRPGVVILEESMSRMGVGEATRAILNLCPEAQVILLTENTAENHVVAAFRAGIRGYVLKTDAMVALARAIQEVTRGRLFLSPGATRGLTEAFVLQPVTTPPEIPR